MKRDTAKTIVGLVIIAGIVVATFMYGNSQRQAQLKHDQEVKDQQVAKATTSPAAAQPTKSPQPVAKAASTSKQTTNTAPVETPSANSIQGSKPSTAAPAPAAGGTVASASTSATPLPQTGPSSTLSGAAGVAVIIGSVVVWRRSKRSVLAAARAQR
jgi:LPXTG-motif cell wall-anchored protein